MREERNGGIRNTRRNREENKYRKKEERKGGIGNTRRNREVGKGEGRMIQHLVSHTCIIPFDHTPVHLPNVTLLHDTAARHPVNLYSTFR